MPFLKDVDTVTCEEMHLADLAELTFPPGLTALHVVACSGDDLDWLHRFAHLSRLGISVCRQVGDLKVLKSLRLLQELSVGAFDGDIDLAPLAGREELKRLSFLSCRSVRGIGDFLKAASLTHLHVAHSKLEIPKLTMDASPPAKLEQLRSLLLNEAEDFTEWAARAQFPVLERLFLTDAKLPSLTTFCRIETLRVLSLVACLKLQSVEDLGKARHLEKLEIVHCPAILDLHEVANLHNLEELTIDGCAGISNLAFFKEIKQLRELHVSGTTRFFDVQIIAELESLESLFLGEADIANLELAGSLRNLRRLAVWGRSGLQEAYRAE